MMTLVICPQAAVVVVAGQRHGSGSGGGRRCSSELVVVVGGGLIGIRHPFILNAYDHDGVVLSACTTTALQYVGGRPRPLREDGEEMVVMVVIAPSF
jgi:hypothetical protein